MSRLNITLPAGSSVCNGKHITFKAPCDCSRVTGIILNGTTYELVDASNKNISSIGNVFTEDAMVSVILDTENNRAYIQNADTISAISAELDNKAPKASPIFTGTPEAPTAEVGTNTTQIATTAFVHTVVDNAIGNAIEGSY